MLLSRELSPKVAKDSIGFVCRNSVNKKRFFGQPWLVLSNSSRLTHSDAKQCALIPKLTQDNTLDTKTDAVLNYPKKFVHNPKQKNKINLGISTKQNKNL